MELIPPIHSMIQLDIYKITPIVCGILTITTIIYWIKSKPPKTKKTGFYKKIDKSSYKPPIIKPVDPGFEWDKTETIKSFPFRNAEYKLTMAIKKVDPQDWLLIEPSYLRTTQAKYKIITNTHPDYPEGTDLRSCTVFAAPEATKAIKEFYTIVTKYMCDKYPMYFQIQGNQIYNGINGKYIPRTVDDVTDPEAYLEYLSHTIEEDFILLLKQPGSSIDEYYFKGGVFAFASGFSPADKFNTPMSAIHEPIPGYKEKLQLSMNRFFERIQIGQFVIRSNFSVQTHNLYYIDQRNKGKDTQEFAEQVPIPVDQLDFNNQVHYRSERQVLTRLPESEAVVFTIRTYLQPMSEIKAEGREVCERLIGAINGLPESIFRYKNGGAWAQAVKSYLDPDYSSEGDH